MIVGLTGSFGTGKSFVASVFKRLGAKVIDADSLARAMAERARADSVHAQVLREPDSAVATLMPSGLEAARSEALAEPVHFELDRSDLTAEAQRRLQEYGYQG